jgi:hypothetical protein
MTTGKGLTDPFIFKVLDICTSHMSSKDNQKLQSAEAGNQQLPAYELSEYGWLVYIGEIQENWGGMSAAFRKVLKVAKQMGCEYVRFDRDGREYLELLTFNW